MAHDVSSLPFFVLLPMVCCMLVDLLPGWDCWPPAPFPPHSHQDASDRAIISGNVNLIWAWASTVPTMPNGGSGWLPMHDNRGFMTLNLLGGAEVWQPLCLPFSLPCELPVVWWGVGGGAGLSTGFASPGGWWGQCSLHTIWPLALPFIFSDMSPPPPKRAG